MTRNYIKAMIRQYFDDEKMNEDLNDADFYEELGLDSLSFVQLMIFCEEKFGYKFDFSKMDFENNRTINNISETIYLGVTDHE